MVWRILIRNSAGQQFCTVAIIHDISERKQMKKELQNRHQATNHEQKFLEAVFEALPIGICRRINKAASFAPNPEDTGHPNPI